jgi:hypothetical protein
LILPGTPAALAAAQQEQFLPSQQNRFTVPKFHLTATKIFTEHGTDLSQFSSVHSHLPNSQPHHIPVKLVMPVHHQFQDVVTSSFVNPTVSTVTPVATKFQVSRTPGSNHVTQPALMTPMKHSINIVPVPATFTLSQIPASNQITHSILHTPLKFETVQVKTTKVTPTLPQTTQSFIHSRNSQIRLQPTVKTPSSTTPSIIVLHNFDNSQGFPETKIEERKPLNVFNHGSSAKFVNQNKVSGETFLDIRGFRVEEASPPVTTFAPVPTTTIAPVTTSTLAPVRTGSTIKPNRVRVTVTKRVRGPARTVISRTVTKVQPRKPVVVTPNPVATLMKESAIPVRPLLIKEVPVTRGPFRFSSTTESAKVCNIFIIINLIKHFLK